MLYIAFLNGPSYKCMDIMVDSGRWRHWSGNGHNMVRSSARVSQFTLGRDTQRVSVASRFHQVSDAQSVLVDTIWSYSWSSTAGRPLRHPRVCRRETRAHHLGLRRNSPLRTFLTSRGGSADYRRLPRRCFWLLILIESFSLRGMTFDARK